MHPLDVWRKRQGYTLKKAAEFLDVPFATLTDWIYFRRFPRSENLSHIEIKTDRDVTHGDMQRAWMEHRHPELKGVVE